MSEIDTLKDYLVKLGFSTNAAQFRAFQNTLANATKSVQGASHSWESAFKWSAAGAVTALGTIAASTVGLLDSVSKADLGYKLFAMHMFMSETAAKRMKIATDALGYSIEDIIWNPELRGRYEDLMKWQDRLDKNLGKGYAGNMKFIRDIRQEFTKMQVTGVYGMQILANTIAEKFGRSLKDGKTWLEEINEIFLMKTPEWSTKVANFLYDLKPIYIGLSVVVNDATKAIGLFFREFGDGSVTFGERIEWSTAAIVGMTEAMFFLAKSSLTLLKVRHPEKSFTDIGKELGQNWKDFKESGTSMLPRAMKPNAGIDMVAPTTKEERRKKGLGGIGVYESGNKYGETNPITGAAGKYQIMPSNWPSWAREAGLPANAAMTPENQELVAQAKWNQYMKQFGGNDQLAATAWFAGPGRAQRLAAGDNSVLNFMDANNTRVSDYIKGTTGRAYTSITIGDVIVNTKTDAPASEIGYEVARRIREITGSIQ
jgi:hypothetical protein